MFYIIMSFVILLDITIITLEIQNMMCNAPCRLGDPDARMMLAVCAVDCWHHEKQAIVHEASRIADRFGREIKARENIILSRLQRPHLCF